jgi:hypothetical protein
MRRMSMALALGLLALLVLAAPAAASRKWCAKDPIVRLNGAHVGIWVAIPEEFESLVTGAIQVKVITPPGVSQELVFLDDGFNGFGEVVKFTESKDLQIRPDGTFDVMAEVWVPIDRTAVKLQGMKTKTIPLQVTIIANGELVTDENGTPEVVNGAASTVEQTNDRTKITFTVESVK